MTATCGDVDVEHDAALARRIQGGDDAAFAELYQRYHDRLHRLCRRRLGDANEAADAVQETFARAWRALSRFDGSWRLYPWLWTIANNVCTDVVRRRTRVILEPLDEAAAGSFDPFEAHAGVVDARDDLARLREVLGDLPERYRQTLVLHELNGLTSRQIAGEHGTTVRAVQTVLVRTRRMLRTAMERPAMVVFGFVARRLVVARRFPTPLRHLRRAGITRPAAMGALMTGAVAASVLTLTLPNPSGPRPAPPGHVPASTAVQGSSAVPTASGPTTPPSPPVTPPGSSPPSTPGGEGGYFSAPGVYIGSAAGPAKTASQEPFHVSAAGVTAGFDVPGTEQQLVDNANSVLGRVGIPAASSSG